MGKKKSADFKSTLATGSPVASAPPAFGRREEERSGPGLVRAAEARAEAQAQEEDKGAGYRRINQGGTGGANARFKYEDLEERKKRAQKMRPRAL